jgi:hypothetical protein
VQKQKTADNKGGFLAQPAERVNRVRLTSSETSSSACYNVAVQ